MRLSGAAVKGIVGIVQRLGQGHADAQNNLGTMYFNGRDAFAKFMTPAQIAEAQRLAREWTAKHGKK